MGLDSFPSIYTQVAVPRPSTLLNSLLAFLMGPLETKKNAYSRIVDGKNLIVDLLRHCISLSRGLGGEHRTPHPGLAFSQKCFFHFKNYIILSLH